MEESNKKQLKYDKEELIKIFTEMKGAIPKQKADIVNALTENNDNRKKLESMGSFVDFKNTADYLLRQKQPRDRSTRFKPKPNSEIALFEHDVIDYHQLKEMEAMDAENIIITFSKKSSAFKNLIQGNLLLNEFALLLRVISKICSSSFHELKGKILMEIISNKFLEKTKNYVLSLAAQEDVEKEKNMHFWSDPNMFWNDLLIFYTTVFNLFPQTANEILPNIIKATVIAINDINKYHKNIDSTTEIADKFDQLAKNILEIKIDVSKKKPVCWYPIDNFRNIDIFPTVNEITFREYPFLNKIIKHGPYKSVEHYLDTHFRLLREDFVGSLRNGICTHLENIKDGTKVKQFDVQLYEKVKFIRPHVTHDRVGILVKIEQINNISVDDKLFMYGSLICFTKDNFKSIMFSTVIDNDISLLKFGYVAVDVEESVIYDENYTMITSTLFFEPYYQVLKTLQSMKEENFPLKKYIIDVSSQVDHPNFLTNARGILIDSIILPTRFDTNIIHPPSLSPTRFDTNTIYPPSLSPTIFDTNFIYPITKFNILNPMSWPSASYFNLNDSQYKAFQAALSREVSVIQGPPGTGKTYTCLKIVEFLLKNKNNLQYSGPILVICYTNHALDQFLEGILSFTKKIVRVGSNSKSEELKKLNLKVHRHTYYYYDYEDLLETETMNINQCIQKIQYIQKLLEDIMSRKGILNFKFLEKIDENLQNSWFGQVKSHQIVDWLMEGMLIKDSNDMEMQEDHLSDEKLQLFSKINNMDNKTKIIDDDEIIDDNNFIITIAEYADDIFECDFDINEARGNEKPIPVTLERERQNLIEKKNYLHWRLNQEEKAENLPDNIDYNNPYKLSPNQRWALYRHWIRLLRLRAYQDIDILDKEYRIIKRRYLEAQQVVDTHIMRDQNVIGMTTTGAAKHQSVLQTLKCQIVVVEEAAEILESHVVSSLTKDCQQLILIGDHLQLKPSTSQYHLAKNYNLEISLFERMIINGIQCHQLDIQHRMRPEISKLITPAIYSNLKDDESVRCYESIRGITKNVFFVTHNEYEDHIYNSTSHKNNYEAQYMLHLASYLVKQGYDVAQITILTTYTGQMFYFWKLLPNFPDLKDMKITVVDNFQGEENDIILLSLVRSNENQNIGFLKTENRVCVALSRARLGFYMIGNMDNLEKSSSIWPKIKEVLVQQKSIGPELELKCEIHNTITNITNYSDFVKVSEGGCSLPCEKMLRCRHMCRLKCHTYDRAHQLYNCQEKCTKIICIRQHVCKQLCSLKCGNCKVKIEKQLPCGHSHFIACSLEPSKYLCPTNVQVTLPCTHKAEKQCYVKTTDVTCAHPCSMKLSCGHNCNRNCHIAQDPNHKQYFCVEKCEKFKKDCSIQRHKCSLRCSDLCEPCTEEIWKKMTNCTHKVKVACNVSVNTLDCKEKCRKTLPCGHFCKNKCFMGCGDCKVMVNKVITTCGHTQKMPCGAAPDQIWCENKCPLLLSCGHYCEKMCNEPCSCTQKCIVQLSLNEENFNFDLLFEQM